jgi:tetratricopeptide (TPR) repeat protein
MRKESYFFIPIMMVCMIHTLSANSTESFHRYFWANYNHFSGNLPQAHNWYTHLFSSNNSTYSYTGYLNFLADTKQFRKIVNLMPSLEKKFSNNPHVQLLFVLALEKTNQPKRADHLIISLSQSFKTNPEIAFRAVQTYIKRKEPENALLTIDAYLNNTPRRQNNFVFYFVKTQLHVQLNQYTLALNAIKQCIDLHPQCDKGWLLYASLCEKEGNIKDALTGYSTFLELTGSNKEIEKHLLTLMLKHKTIEDNKQVLLSHTISLDNALVLYKQHRYPQALEHINSCIAQQPLDNKCKLLKIQILSTMKEFDQAAQNIIAWITEQPHNNLWPQALCLLAHNGMDKQRIIDTLTQCTQTTTNNLWCNLYLADMLMRAHNIDKAIHHLTQALSCTMTDNLRATTLYQLALLQYDHHNYPAMLEHLEKAYALNNNHPHVNNTLAYYWATKGKDCAKAHAFINKALTHDPQNPYFLDTHALILYKEKKYSHAQQILEQLTAHNNSTILLHLAKVHYALNNKENADTFTKKAQTLVKNNHEKKALHKMQLLLAQT